MHTSDDLVFFFLAWVYRKYAVEKRTVNNILNLFQDLLPWIEITFKYS